MQPKLARSFLSNLLHQPTVSAIYRDSRGVLWIGTQQGLHMYDGANHVIFNSERNNRNWIPSSDIRDIAEDSAGDILVVTSGKDLLKWNWRLECFEKPYSIDTPNGDQLIGIHISKQESVWLITSTELMLWDPRFKRTSQWLKDVDLVSSIGKPHTITEDNSGNILLGGDIGLAKIYLQDEKVDIFSRKNLDIPENSRLAALSINDDNTLVIGTDTGYLVVFDLKNELINAKAVLSESGPIFISKILMHEDKLIIATDRGIFISDKQLSSVKNLEVGSNSLSDHDVYSLLSDGEYVWIGTGNGLDIMSFTSIELFNQKNSGVRNDILSFAQDENGRMWVGTYTGLYRYDQLSRTHTKIDIRTVNPDLSDERITTISARKNELWIGYFRGGIQIVDSKSGSSKTLNLSSTPEMAITKILASADSSDVWIATYDNGLFRISGEESTAYYGSDSLPEKTITTLFRSHTNSLLAVSDNRIYMYDASSDRFSRLDFDFKLVKEAPTVYSFSENINNDILLGTKDHGPFIWTHEDQLSNTYQATPLSEDGVLSASIIYGIETDSAGNLWCSTQNGIVKLSPSGRFIKRFTTADGLQGNDFNLGASFTSQEGLIYFGGVNGYNRFDPSAVEIDNSVSPMLLTGIELPREEEGKPRAVADLTSLQLNHKDHFVTFQFSVLDFIQPEKNQFRFKLVGFDPEWIESGARNTATYTRLPPGEYIFRAQGANSAGIWNREGITLDIHVLPAPWYSWWAFCIYGLVTLLLYWGSLRIYRSYAIEKQSAQLAENMFEAENRADDEMHEQLELQDELVQSAFRHNLTTLALVSDCISHGVDETVDINFGQADSDVKRIAALACLEDCIFYQAGGPVANLQKYTNLIVSKLLKHSPVSPETFVTVNEISSRLIPVEIASPLAIVLYELLENCIQHAFEIDSPANYIQIRLETALSADTDIRTLVLSVHDSGIGCTESLLENTDKGAGIAIVKSIVTRLGGSMKLTPDSGSTVVISIPDPSY